MADKPKRLNPYQRLLKEVVQFCREVRYPRRIEMFYYSKKELKSSTFNLNELYERTKAADDLGYDVMLEANEAVGLIVRYVKKRPDIPYEWR